MLRKFKNKSLEPRYIVLIILLVIILFIAVFSYTLKKDRNLNPFEKIVKDILVTGQNIVLAPVNYVQSVASSWQDLQNVRKENAILKENIDKIELTETENLELKNQIAKLKEELNIEYTLADYTKINATVLSRNIGFWYNTMTIDKGTYSKLKKDMIVITNKGLVGKIINTSNFTSTVKLVTATDSNSKVSVTVTNGTYKLNGLIYDYDEEKNILEVEGISNTEAVTIGDSVYTSGLGGIFPSGILVGKVYNITVDEYGLSKTLMVKPSLNYDDISYVAVLRRNDSKWLTLI